MDIFGGHFTLLGIVFGYGEQNSKLFELASRQSYPPYRYEFGKSKKDRMGDSVDHYSDTLYPYHLRLFPVIFRTDPNAEETKKLKAQYEKTRKVILEKMDSEDPFDIVFEALQRQEGVGAF